MATGASSTEQHLARKITPGLLLVLVVGNVLGAGIYVVTGEVTEEVGAGVWLAFLIAFGVAAVSALSLCELVTKYPGAAGVAVYVDRAFGRPVLTFTVGFSVLASGLTSAATAARAFGGDYLVEFVAAPTIFAAAAFLAVLASINYWGIVESLRANVVMTVIEAAGLALVIAAALALVGSGEGDIARPLQETRGDALVPLALLSGAAIAFFSFLGFEDTANMSEEVRRPRISYPVALFGGLAATATLYLAVVYLSVAAVGPDRIANSSAPLLVVINDSPIGVPTRLFAAIALIAVANTALANLVMGSRLLFGLARKGLLPSIFGVVDPRRATPTVAVAATGVLALALAATGDLGALARTTVLLLLGVLTLMNVSAIRLRRDRVTHDHFAAPGWAAWVGATTCAVLIVNQVATGDRADPVRAALVVLAGLSAYLLEHLRKGRRARSAA